MIRFRVSIFLVLLLTFSALSFASSEANNPFRKVARDVTPVVVQIDTVFKTKVKAGSSPFDYFFRNDKESDEEGYREFESKGLGSGIVVEVDGNKKYVLTNNHVIDEADELNIHFTSGKSYKAEIVGSDKRKDLALLLFETSDDIPVAKLGNSDELYIGDWAIAIGSPLGYESSVTVGIISAIGRTTGNGGMVADFTDYIQTDAAINKGNSGGALVNIDGEIIGINTWIASQTGGSIGLGFSIPINNAKKVIRDLINKGSVEYGWLGVSMSNIPAEYLEEEKELEGAFIHSLYKGSPANKGKLQAGDIITKINSDIIKNSNDLLKVVGNLPANELAIFNIIRDKKSIILNIFPELRGEDSFKPLLWPGINSVTLTKDIIDSYNERTENKIKASTKGVIVASVTDGSVAKLTGMIPGDIITHIDGKKVTKTSELYSLLGKSSTEITLNVIRNGNKIKLILMND